MTKPIIAGIITCVMLVGALAGYSAWDRQRQAAKFIRQVDRQLSDDEKQIYADRLLDAETRLAAAKDDQERADLLIYQGFQYQGLGELSVARDRFLQAASLTPDNYNIYLNLHLTYLEMGDDDSAEASIQQAIGLKSDLPDIWRKYLTFQAERRQSPAAALDDLYQEALVKTENSPYQVDIVTSYAVWLERQGRLDDAIKQWQKAIGLYPSNEALYKGEIDRLDAKK